MNDDKRKPPVVARDVGFEEYPPEEDEEGLIRILDDPYLSEVYESLKDEIERERGEGVGNLRGRDDD